MANDPLVVKNPYSGEELSRLPFVAGEQLRAKLDEALEALERWKNSTSFVRAQLLEAVADQLEARREELAALIRDEAGKPIAYARIEVGRCLGVLRWAAAEAQRFAGELLRIDTTPSGREGFGLCARFSRGVILGITPFNFPLNLVAHKVAPAVACGCPILIKPSPLAPLSSMRLAELFASCGAPQGLVQVVLADDEATAQLTRAPEIAMVSFTGSARVGKLIRAQTGGKPLTLELGGNAWALVLEDTPRESFPAIAKRLAGAAYGYAGQSCISVQNVAASSAILGELREQLEKATSRLPFGDPSDPEVISGPVINDAASARIRAELERVPRDFSTVTSTEARGKNASPRVLKPTLVCIPPGAGDLSGLSLVQEEVFGPVMNLMAFDTLDEAIERVNSGRYGLQTGVFTQNWAAIEKLYRELRVGGLVVNDAPTTRYDHQPYGGVRDSGQGREGIRYAMEEMTEPKFLALSSRIPG